MRKLTTTMKILLLLVAFILPRMQAAAQIVISQYIETNSGTTPKGIELWNTSSETIDFSAKNLDILKGQNGKDPVSVKLINTGTLAAGEVIVIGTSDLTPDYEKPFSFNGDDALVIKLNEIIVDVFGNPGSDPGSEWKGNGVSTKNQNIQLKTGISTGSLTGWTDPSIRFEMVGDGSDMTGFGIAPTTGGGTFEPEPTNHVTSFTAGTIEANSISLTWADNDGAQAASSFLIIASTGTPTAPIDGNPVANDADFNDDNGAINVTHGEQACIFEDLTAGTEYNFAIYPYTNTGANIDFKTDGTVPTINATTTAAAIPTKLAITNVIPASPTTGQIFSITVQAQDATNASGNVTEDTEVTIALATGTGTISGTVTGTIVNGASSIEISGLTYDVVESINVNASVKTGMTLSASANQTITFQAPASATLPYSQDFETGLGNIYSHSVSGNTKEWHHDNTKGIASINGYNSGDLEEDWLILPSVNLSSKATKIITFDTWYKYGKYDADNYLKLYYSESYVGIGDPSTVSDWTELTFDLPSNTEEWTTSGNINLNGISGSNVHLAFKYHYNSGSYRSWSIDNIEIKEEASGAAPVIANITSTPNEPSSTDDVTITAEVTGTNISSVVLNWGTNTGILTNNIAMSATGNVYSGLIAQQANGTTIYYTITATDTASNISVSDEKSYSVVDLSTPTQLAITMITPTSPVVNTPFAITVEAQDTAGVKGNVNEDTEVTITLATGTGTISGTVTGTIVNGASSIEISGLTYDVVESINVNASIASGMSLAVSDNYEITITDIPVKPKVFFSEYIEGSSQNKALEIYNGTNSNIDMENFRIAYAPNEKNWDVYQTFTNGTIVANNDVFVVATDQADSIILAQADEEYPYPSVCHFNGDDAIALEFTNDGGTSWEIIDIIGIPGEKVVCDVAGVTEATKDHTLIRKTTVTTGNTNWTTSAGTSADDSEWLVKEKNDFTGIGWYGVPLSSPVIANITSTPNEPSSTDDVTITADVTDEDGTISSVELRYGNVTATYTEKVIMNNTKGATYSGLIPAQANGETVYYQIAAIDNDNNETVSTEMSYNVVNYNPATQLAIISNDPVSPIIGQAFNITVQSQDANGVQGIVTENTEVTIQLETGNETLAGELTATILSGTYSVTISGLTYDAAESISVKATATSGMSLTASADYDITIIDIPTTPMVFFSEYIEGSSQNKALEIYNGTDSNIDMENFRIAYAPNEKDWDVYQTFTNGTIVANNDVFVIATDQADPTILEQADEKYSYPSVCHFNGDDAIALEFTNDGGTSWEIIDIIGIPGEKVVCDVAGVTEATKDHTLVRKYPDIVMGNPNWNTSAGTNADNSEWIVKEKDDFTSIGWHGAPSENPSISSVVITPQKPTSNDEISISAEVTSPSGTISTVELNWGIISGTLNQTITMSISEGNTYVTDTKIPKQTNGTTVYYTIKATDNNTLETVTNEKSFTVKDASIVALPYLNPFETDLSDMVTYSVVGEQEWKWDNNGYAKASGYNGSANENEDWLITPGLNFSAVSDAKLVFDEAINFASDIDNKMTVLASTDYAGIGDPATATWTKLTVTGRATGDSWNIVTVNDVNLSEYAGNAIVHVAFKYMSTTEEAGTWEVDNIKIEEAAALIAPVIENITTNPIKPTSNDDISISASISDANGTVETATLHWGTDIFYNKTIKMTNENGDTWVSETAIPAQANNTQIFYKIVATDNESNETATEDLSFYSFDPYTGELPYVEPFHYSLETMNQISVTGDQKWRWDNYGYAKASGYASGSANKNEDWLITPTLDLSNAETVALNFREAINFAVNITEEQKIMISTDYDGTSEPSTATWTELTVDGRASGDSWNFVSVKEVNLENYIGQKSVYIAFKYISTTDGAATWEIDDVSVSNKTSIIFNSNNSVNVYPNPAYDELFITHAENAQIDILSLDGKVIMTEQLNNNSVNISNLSNGLYIIRVINGDKVSTKRFIKK